MNLLNKFYRSSDLMPELEKRGVGGPFTQLKNINSR